MNQTAVARPRGPATRGFVAPLAIAGAPGTLMTATTVVLLFALILGGGTRQGLMSDAIVQLASLPLLGIALLQLRLNPPTAEARWPLVILGALLVVPIVQIIPLPPAVWTHIPGRQIFAANYGVAGLPLPWLPISLDSGSTIRSGLTLLPGAAIFLAMLSLEPRDRRTLTLVLIGFGLASFLLGLAQLFQGPTSELRFHAITNPNQAVGFFANRNHFASLLYCMIPFTAAWAAALFQDQRRDKTLGLILCLGVYACVILGLGLTKSRSGLLLTLVGGAASFLIVWLGLERGKLRTRALWAVSIATVIGVLAIMQFALLGLLTSVEETVTGDRRFTIYATTARAALDFLPFGSGLGTFQRIYMMYETPAIMFGQFINRAHNDWLEGLLETGVLGGLLALGFLAWYGAISRRVWSRRVRAGLAIDAALSRGAWVVIGLLLLHSLTDYPLRTTAQMAVFSLSLGLLIRSSRGAAPPADEIRKPVHEFRDPAPRSAAHSGPVRGTRPRGHRRSEVLK